MHDQITVNLLQKYLIRLRQVLLVKSLYRPIIVTELYHFLAANAVIGSCICSSINSKIFCFLLVEPPLSWCDATMPQPEGMSASSKTIHHSPAG